MGNSGVGKEEITPFFTKFPFYKKRLVRFERTRSSDETRIQLLAKYGIFLHSFLTEKYLEV